jgi:hypothetical protein
MTMSVIGELHAVAARLSFQDNRPICACCEKGRLVLVDERPDPNFGILGVMFGASKLSKLQIEPHASLIAMP